MRLLLALMIVALAPLSAQAFSDQERKDIEAIVRQYLLDNPMLLQEVGQKMQAEQEARQAEATKAAIKENVKDLFETNEHPIMGSAKARVPLVEFFDYNCGYCKMAYPQLREATDKNQDVKVILIDTPILGPSSQLAASWSIAAHHLGKGLEFHEALMEFQGPKSEETLTDLAKKAGLDPAKVKAAADGDKVKAQLAKNMELFSKLGISWTPAFVAPDRLIRGEMTPASIDAIVKDYLDKNPTVKR